VDQKRLKIAHHEIGHAVMALICGQAIQKVSLREMDSPRGTDKYHAFTKLEPIDPKIKFTVQSALQRIMISLGGYASEILFSDGGSAGVGGDDLSIAAKLTEDVLEVEEFRSWVAKLPIPGPSALDRVENVLVRKCIVSAIDACVKALAPHKPVIQVIAKELYEREELTGDDVAALFRSSMQSSQRANQMNRPAPVL
jgi:ATP-dependent Zn protease